MIANSQLTKNKIENISGQSIEGVVDDINGEIESEKPDFSRRFACKYL